MILLDLSAAFDTVDLKILDRLEKSVGLSGTILNWFRSYLEGRGYIVATRNVWHSILGPSFLNPKFGRTANYS